LLIVLSVEHESGLALSNTECQRGAYVVGGGRRQPGRRTLFAKPR
jgi:hypothetical protein